MKTGASFRGTLLVKAGKSWWKEAWVPMLHVGLDLSRTRVDVHAMDEMGTPVVVTTASPDAGGLACLVERLGRWGQPVCAAIESMNGARFVHDQLELAGWRVEIADAQKVKGLAPLACKTDPLLNCGTSPQVTGMRRSIYRPIAAAGTPQASSVGS